MRPPVIVAAVLILAGCGASGEGDDLARLDNQLQANAADPARDPLLAQALGDQIMVDPRLTQQSNANAIRPPDRPDGTATVPTDIAASPDGAPDPADLAAAPEPKGDCPECRARPAALTLEAAAERSPARSACLDRVTYSATWANRLPVAAPLFPDARVVEAAGVDEAGCSYRLVTYRSSAPLGRLTDWHYTKARAAGFSAEHRAEGSVHVVGGTKGRSAYLVYLRPRNGGTDVDVIANGG